MQKKLRPEAIEMTFYLEELLVRLFNTFSFYKYNYNSKYLKHLNRN